MACMAGPASIDSPAMGKKEKMLNVHEAAERLGQPVSSVRVWVWSGRFPGARKESTPLGEYWLIPESSLEGFEPGKRGRPAKKGRGRKQ
jgi:hypothetical protein